MRTDDINHDPIRATLVAADAEMAILRHEDPRAGVVHIHFPRAGYELEPTR